MLLAHTNCTLAAPCHDRPSSVPDHHRHVRRLQERIRSDQLPASLAAVPWALPLEHAWCAPPAKPRIFVVLTAAVQAFVNLRARGLRQQQRNQTERREMYEKVVRHWAVASNVNVIFAENSGADLASIEAQVPPWRAHRFEFLRVERFAEKLPSRARPDVGRLEAQSIVYALNNSQLLASRCPHDLVFGVTGRYFVHDFEHLVHDSCLRGRSREEQPWVYIQKPEWLERAGNERETSILGFTAAFALEVHGWAVMPLAGLTFDKYVRTAIGSEVHLGKLVRMMDARPPLKGRACDLPPLPILPMREGSTNKLRTSV